MHSKTSRNMFIHAKNLLFKIKNRYNYLGNLLQIFIKIFLLTGVNGAIRRTKLG